MKTILNPFIFTALFSFLLLSCAKNDDFSIPKKIDCDGVDFKETKTLQDIYAIATETPTLYEKDDIISGYVVSSDEGGNFFKELYLVSQDNKFSVKIPVEKTGLFTRYNIGRKVLVKLKDLYIQKDNGVLVIGSLTINKSGKAYAGRIEDPTYKKRVLTYCGSEGGRKSEAEMLNVITLKQAVESDDYLGKLVRLKDVQFAVKEVNKTYYDANDNVATKGGATNRILIGKEVSNTILFRTGSFAEYSGDVIPVSSGTITGIITKFGKEYQFIARTKKDIQLTQERFGEDDIGGGEEPGEITIGNLLVFPGSDFEDFNVFLGSLKDSGVIKKYATQQVGKGWEEGNALGIIGTPEKTEYVFNALNGSKTVDGATKISFLIKGTADSGVSINLYKPNGVNYEVFNLGNIESSITLDKAEPNSSNPENGKNIYSGKINTKGNWVKVTLNLTGVQYNTNPKGQIFALKVGKTKNDEKFDLLIDEIRFEDGVLNDNGGDDNSDDDDDDNLSKLAFPGGDFEDWDSFKTKLSSLGIVSYATQQIGQGRNNSNALGIITDSLSKNDYIFTLENIKDVPSGATKINFYIKGTSTKSLCLNLFKNDGTSMTYFNVGAVTTNNIVVKSSGKNNYIGAIDTAGQWVKVTLDLAGVEYNTSGTNKFISLRVGKDSTYDLLLDDFTIE